MWSSPHLNINHVLNSPSDAVSLAAMGKAYDSTPNEPGATDYELYKRHMLKGLELWVRLKLEWAQGLDKHKDRADALAEAAHEAEANELQEAYDQKADEALEYDATMNSLFLLGTVPSANRAAYNEAEQNFNQAKVEHGNLERQIKELGYKRKAAQDISRRAKQRRVAELKQCEEDAQAVARVLI